jgi:fatty acid desaturase
MMRAVADACVRAALRFELPTWGLIVVVYAGWFALTFYFHTLPWWLLLPLAAWFMAWHMSLQHEILHGHPTRYRWFNTLLGFAPLCLWLPYERYRCEHLIHHRKAYLTDPLEDPESFYLTAHVWQRRGALARALTRIHNTLAGRLLLGPARTIALFLAGELRALRRGSRTTWRIWIVHVLGIAAVLWWTSQICHIPFWVYVACFVYPGYALSSLRSFAEHRAAALADHRTAIVEDTPLFGLLFLHNNLHVLHHDNPALPWYLAPRVYRANREALIRQNNALVYRGYREVVRRYLFTEHDAPLVPMPAAAEPE